MNLEMRMLNVRNLGVIDYKTLREKQEEYNSLLAKSGEETLLVAECKPHIDFGSNTKKNIFSDVATQELAKAIGKSPYINSQTNELSHEAQRYLLTHGLGGLTFSISNRGGGATVLAPGQLLYFCAVDVARSVKQAEKFKAMEPFITGLNDVMLNTIKQYISDAHLREMNYSEVLKSPNYDVGVIRNGKPYKLGSKGISIYEENKHLLSRGGFSIHLHPDGNKFNHYVHACGISPNDMGITSLNEVVGKNISPNIFSESIIQEFVKTFGFDGYSFK